MDALRGFGAPQGPPGFESEENKCSLRSVRPSPIMELRTKLVQKLGQ